MESTNTIQIIKPTYHLLKFTFGIVPIVAGLDKFTNILTHWENYINPSMAAIIPFDSTTFMMIVGIIEIIAGIIVLKKTEIGAYIVAAWLTLIALTLITSGNFLDVAVRDLVMAIAAFSTAKLAKIVA
ncbi:hypothetical protein EOD40_11130 [Flavobacterium sufflavum]|uniref:tRNA (5-methylaminomethyl-2-thiouridylate)-methyltransferase n=1 Tax=Flavobacterium sufflavum TaxID=1921138 RepID=A0A3S2U4N2_9FLAO|nr:hypothetical protein [Flavobacterium sufflavum]RVT75313.1 hypothetical protein EOD40_11130 [Flavobacterium sufflavum]